MSTLEEIRQDAENKGMVKGLTLGTRKGKLEGREENRKEIALRMLKHGMDVNTIRTITELPLEEVEKLKKQQK